MTKGTQLCSSVRNPARYTRAGPRWRKMSPKRGRGYVQHLSWLHRGESQVAQNVAHEVQAARDQHVHSPRAPAAHSPQPYAHQSVLQRRVHAVGLPRMHGTPPCTPTTPCYSPISVLLLTVSCVSSAHTTGARCIENQVGTRENTLVLNR